MQNEKDTLAFLSILLSMDAPEDVPVTWQLIPDRGRGFPAHFSAPLTRAWDRLAAANRQGMGVFLMVNEGDLQGRAAKNVRRVRAIFVDLDGADLQPLREAVPPPNLIVESSPGRYHAYWIVSDCELSQFRAAQKELAARFGGDPKICDLPRVMRVPGFLHQKRGPVPSRILASSPGGHSMRDLSTGIFRAELAAA